MYHPDVNKYIWTDTAEALFILAGRIHKYRLTSVSSVYDHFVKENMKIERRNVVVQQKSPARLARTAKWEGFNLQVREEFSRRCVIKFSSRCKVSKKFPNTRLADEIYIIIYFPNAWSMGKDNRFPNKWGVSKQQQSLSDAYSWQNTKQACNFIQARGKMFTEPSEHKRKYTSYAACRCSASKKYFHRVYLDVLPLCTSTLICTVVPCGKQQRAIKLATYLETTSGLFPFFMV